MTLYLTKDFIFYKENIFLLLYYTFQIYVFVIFCINNFLLTIIMLPLDASHYLRNLFRNIIHLEIYYIFINTSKQYKFEISLKIFQYNLNFSYISPL